MPEKVIDPGAEFSNPRESKLAFIIGFVERHPACTLPGGEAHLLVQEIRRLERLCAPTASK
jgi:hypothetical protein